MYYVKQATKRGFIECCKGGVADLLQPSSKTRRGRTIGGGLICPTLMAGESGLYILGNDKDYVKKEIVKKEIKMKQTKPIRLIELFAGYGSQAMALRNIGADFETHKVVEFDKYAIASYNAIHGTNEVVTDVTQVTGWDLDIDDTDEFTYLLTYSFPCTDLSLAGEQKGMSRGSGTRSGLLWEVERLLEEIDDLPQVLVMETVPQVIGKKNMPDFKEWLAYLESRGYKNYYKILNSMDYGVAQSRKRCFMVSLLGDYDFEFPEPFELEYTIKDYLEENPSAECYCSDKQKALIHARMPNGSYKYNYASNVFPHSNKNVAGTITTRAGQRPSDNFIITNGGIFDPQVGEVVDEDRNIIPIEDVIMRKLTPKECGRLMGVRDEDVDKMMSVNSNAQCYKQFGNSIVVDVLEYLFKNIIESLERGGD